MLPKRGIGECGYPIQSRYPNMPISRVHCEYGPKARGQGSPSNFNCNCERLCSSHPNSPTEKTKKKKIAISGALQNENLQLNQMGSNKMFYWVIHDPENTDPRINDIVCIDSAENRPLKPAGATKKECGRNEICWEYVSDKMPGPRSDDVLRAEKKKRSVKGRKPTATFKHSHKIRKHIRNKIKEIHSAPEELDENVLKFDFPAEIREPQPGDLICWLGKSKDGPLSGVRAIWEAEEITQEPGKMCWLGREVTDRDTNAALCYDYKSSSEKHSWKSRPGFCLPPISCLRQKPIDLLQRLIILKSVSYKTSDPVSQKGPSFEDYNLPQSISAYNIPSELLKSVSWQDFQVNKMRAIIR